MADAFRPSQGLLSLDLPGLTADAGMCADGACLPGPGEALTGFGESPTQPPPSGSTGRSGP